MTNRLIEGLEILVPMSMRIGVYANAFRIFHDSGDEFFLDFIHYSESEKLAQVVSRVRIHLPMIDAIQKRMALSFEEISAQKLRQAAVVVLGQEDMN